MDSPASLSQASLCEAQRNCRSELMWLLVMCQESVMELYNALRDLFCKGQNKENLLRNSLMNQFRIIPKTESVIVIRITHKSTTLTARRSEHRQAFINK
jgi:hypothetical protein